MERRVYNNDWVIFSCKSQPVNDVTLSPLSNSTAPVERPVICNQT